MEVRGVITAEQLARELQIVIEQFNSGLITSREFKDKVFVLAMQTTEVE